MHSLLMNDFGDPSGKLGEIGISEISDEYAKLACLLFDRLYVAQLWTEGHGVPGGYSFADGDGSREAYFGTNHDYLRSKEMIRYVRPGGDDVLLRYIENRVDMIEQNTGDRVLVHHCFLDWSRDMQAVLSISFLADIIPAPGNVSLDDVLEFKNSRRPELLALWDMIYETALDPTGLLKNKPEHILRTRLASMLADLERSQRESWSGSLLRRFSLQYLLPLSAIMSLDFFQQVPPVVLAMIGGVSFSLGWAPARNPSNESARALTFVLDSQRELRSVART